MQYFSRGASQNEKPIDSYPRETKIAIQFHVNKVQFSSRGITKKFQGLEDAAEQKLKLDRLGKFRNMTVANLILRFSRSIAQEKLVY